ncbi:MAG: hypothetical protein PF518_08585 [Spirochaetaceae bacterium]|nr:hypothetical protein [Spirochaetaceae bacterium]
MEKPENIPDEFIKGINAIVIDASSLIYHLKVGILGFLAAEMILISSEQVIEEVGWPHLPVMGFTLDNSTLTNDETIVELAKLKKLPVLSEDKEVLLNAKNHGLSYYNSLMMLNYLLLKKRISLLEYPEYLHRLIDISHYSEDILEYGNRIKNVIEKKLD